MDLAGRIYIKAYYYFANIILREKKLDIHDSFRNARNIILYFDYEREFGGHDTCICDEDIHNILNSLDQYNLNATWFTVGKIFEHYPGSIEEILSRGHEIGSHTYAHLAPLKSSVSNLKKDFQHFQNVSSSYTRVKGFHYPNSKWSISTLKELGRYDFIYDMVYCREQFTRLISERILSRNKKVLRFCSIGDDWPLYKKETTEENAYNHFVNLYEKVKTGSVCGIGFHPWVLISDENIMKGFLKFLKYLAGQENKFVKTAVEFATLILDHHKLPVENK